MSYRSVFKENLFAGQNIIVTGGGSGIGRCTAHELAALGARVVLIGRKQEKLDAVAAEIAEDGGQALGFSCDIRDEEAVKATVGDVYKAVDVVHGLVNNAGGQFPSPLALISQKGWETVVRTNLTGGFLMAREVFLQGMNKNGGAIVNIVADMWGGMPGMGHSGAAVFVHALQKHFPGHQKAAGQVGAHHGFPAFLTDQGQRRRELATGVVDQTVDHVYSLVDVADGGFYRFFITDITRKAQRLSAVFGNFGGHGIQLFLFAADEYDTGAQGRQFVGGATANAGAAAGDNDVLAGKQVFFKDGTV